MIESITISGTASYGDGPEALDVLSKFNFVYGSNGSGKTTISRVIASEAEHPTCRVSWKGGARLQALVYNRDFVARNFGPSTELKGIFTLGEKNVETLEKIMQAKRQHDAFAKSIADLNETLGGMDGTGGKRGELFNLEEQFKATCWAQKKKHDGQFAMAFEGVRNNAENFKTRVLQERVNNSAELLSLADIQARALTIFGASPSTEQLVATIAAEKVLSHESNAVLKKRVLGKEDVDIAAMIKKLGNSDWVREGRGFFEVNDGMCPFCQQRTEESFAESLAEYFDETFVADSRAIDDLATSYAADAERVQAQLAAILVTPSKFIDATALTIEKELLDSRVSINFQRLMSKKREPSQTTELESLASVLAAVADMIKAANNHISSHNDTMANLVRERRLLGSQVWRYIVSVELKSALDDYESKKSGLSRAIEALSTKIRAATEECRSKAVEIAALERGATSIQPTIDAINVLLASFGFHGFSLAKAENGTRYTLRRPDGADARETLSEPWLLS